MKYSLPSRVNNRILQKADEIKIEYRDRAIVFEYIEEFPKADIILCIPTNAEEFDIKIIKAYNEKAKDRFYCELEDISLGTLLKQNNIKFFWKYPVTTFYDLRALKEFGVSQVLIGAPLFFSMDRIKKFNIPIRIIPNTCFETNIPRENGVCGTWVRPQDTYLYEDYVYMFEFKAEHLKQYTTLYEIYAEKQEYIHNMNILFPGFNYSILAISIPTELPESRLNCGQVCAEGRCALCTKAFTLGNLIQDRFVESK